MDSDSDDDEEIKQKKQTKEKKEKKKDSDDEDNSEESNKKQIEKKEESDEDNESSEKKEEKKKKVENKKTEKKESESNSDDEEEKPRAKETAKKEEDSDDEKKEENSNDEKEENDDKNEELPENAFEELFVRNIGFNTTQEELAEAFQKYGDVEESKICTDKQTGKSKGFGFLKFYEKKSAVAAMKDADNIVVGGRNLQIRYSNDKSAPIKGGGNNNGGKKGPTTEFGIFVGNISYKCNENDLKKFFKDCGKVVDVRIAKKPDGKLKGFAHVDFENKEAVDKAVGKNGEELQGRALKIDRSQGGKGGNGNRGGQGGRGRGREPVDPLAKARKSGGIIAPTENKVTTYDDSSDDE